MSITDIMATAWKAFWSNVTSPGFLSVFVALVVCCLLLGFALRRTLRAIDFALRAGAFLLAVTFIVGILGVLGIQFTWLNPLINWFLEIVHAPIYVGVQII
ncbi:hypothetical protein [Bombiscardovia coagulans]|uniref:Uncharacterized protein n=1 Tax=Bombiscardovia coagulans TaxID=686666 RepID=A0A261ESK8_9BIFI|nr:hypothetical protein [Bombiscardovia coagulans]OZG49841.1 hypothetical protein BOCO_0358 [Bombiscardovia coagulans]